ncbi:hypothetical protein N7492_008388 [Penicillium capsulatum]|uniref:Uncharacterized protein n=1 Tax=Penicillium capsulatum TaxID=69766 RepID=A0A9W9HSL2_9EURO|nr:hypothetical protein N7492_008388 [Penicillium capsulatum]KAJ6105790.1 hypothetical protein N7512_009307 [Penicillium capsulatum]
MPSSIEDVRPSTANELQQSRVLVCCLDEPDNVASLDTAFSQKETIPVLTPRGRVNKKLHVLLRSSFHPLLQRKYIPTREGHFAKELRVWVGMDLDYHGPTADASKFIQLLEVAAVADKLHIQLEIDQPRAESSARRVFWMELYMHFDARPPGNKISPTEHAMIPAAAKRHFRLLKELHARG